MPSVEVVANYIQTDRASSTPLFMQIKQGLDKAISAGYFQESKLPSTRNLADQLSVSLNTVLMAYDELEAQGIIYAKPRSGRYVNPEIAVQQTVTEPPASRGKSQDWMRRAKNTATPGNPAQVKRSTNDSELLYPFITASIPKDSFPSSTWIKASREALQAESRSFSLYDNFGADDPLLVEKIITEVLAPRGIVALPENIILTAGTQHALYLISELLVKEGTPVAVEDPGYPDARHTFLRAGAAIAPIALDKGGIKLEDIPDNTELIYTTPSHQLPSNISMSTPRKGRLLQLAKRLGACIIEDDYDAEMRFVGRSSPPVASQGLDNVIYISGFSKYLGAVCRIAFIVAHGEAISALRDIRRYQLRNLSGHEQRTLAHFIKNGGYDQQIRTMRKVAKQRWQACQRLIAELLPEWTVTKSTGGLNLWVELPEPVDTKALAKSLREYSVVIEPGLVFFSDNKQGGRFIKLGFVLLSEEQLRDGLLIIRDVLKPKKAQI